MLYIRVLTLMGTVAVLAIGTGSAAAADSLSTEVVIMDCGARADDTFKVNDISSTGGPEISKDTDCAVALQKLILEGFHIVAGGGGAQYDWHDENEHVVYTLTRVITQITTPSQRIF